MPEVNVNGVPIQYPATGDTEWGDEATEFAIQTAAAFLKLGLSTGTSVDIPSTLTVAGTTTLNGTANLNGNTNIGNANTDTIAVTGILNIDSGTLYVNPTDNRVGINDSSPSEALDVVGNALVSGSITAASATLTDLTVDTNLIKTNSTDNRVGINTTSPQEALDVTGKILVSSDITIGGVLIADDSTNVTTAPPIAFTGDTNTGIGHSAADTLDFVTNGQPRFRIEPTGQIKAVYESTIGFDYNTQLDNGYLCRAWVNFNGTSSNLTGTYSRTGTTITVSITSHGLTSGQSVYLDFTTGAGTDGIYIVTVVNANSYTVTDTVSGSTSGNVTQFRYIRASGNVSSITDNNTGDYTINFTTAMPDGNYAINGFGQTLASSGTAASVISVKASTSLAVGSFTIRSFDAGIGFVESEIICIGVFR